MSRSARPEIAALLEAFENVVTPGIPRQQHRPAVDFEHGHDAGKVRHRRVQEAAGRPVTPGASL